jgi:hypothetical protein
MKWTQARRCQHGNLVLRPKRQKTKPTPGHHANGLCIAAAGIIACAGAGVWKRAGEGVRPPRGRQAGEKHTPKNRCLRGVAQAETRFQKYTKLPRRASRKGETMDYRQKIEWMSRYRKNMLRLEALKQKKERITSFAERTTTSFSFAPGGSGEDRIQVAAERQEEIDFEILEIERILPEQKKEIVAALGQIGNGNHRKVLYYFYIVCLSWADVADLAGYAERYARDLRNTLVEKMEL